MTLRQFVEVFLNGQNILIRPLRSKNCSRPGKSQIQMVCLLRTSISRHMVSLYHFRLLQKITVALKKILKQIKKWQIGLIKLMKY